VKHKLSSIRYYYGVFFLLALQPPSGVVFYSPLAALASSLTRFLDHIQRRATVGRTPLNEWSVRRRELYLTTHNTHNRQTYMPRVGFEPTISAGERPKTYALDRAATGNGLHRLRKQNNEQGICNFWANVSLPCLLRKIFRTLVRSIIVLY